MSEGKRGIDGKLLKSEPKRHCTVTTSSGDANGGFPANSRGNTVQTLPPELWELIFKKLENPSDLLNCWNATCGSAWATALRTTDFYFKMVLKFVLHYLSGRDLIECSKVSNSWNAIVDNWIAHNLHSFSGKAWSCRQIVPLQLNEFSEFPDCINEFGLPTIPINPVPFRRVQINLTFDELCIVHAENQDLVLDHRTLLECLDHCGHLIMYLDIMINGEENVSCVNKMKLIQHLLERTSNLRTLGIEAFREDHEAPNENELEAFNVFISENPWPTIEHLNVLRILAHHLTDYEQTEYASIANAYGPQLHFLVCGHDSVAPQSLVPARFSNLLNIMYYFSTLGSPRQFEAFLRVSRCQIKHLMVWLDPDEDLNAKNWKDLTMAINAVSPTLETLRLGHVLTLNEFLNFELRNFEQLRLPRLKVLDLESFGYPCLNFLKSVCPALKQLTVDPSVPDYTGPEMRKAGTKYAFLYSQHDFWNGLAELEIVRVKCMFGPRYILEDGGRMRGIIQKKIPGRKVHKKYTRRGYEAKLEEGRVIRANN